MPLCGEALVIEVLIVIGVHNLIRILGRKLVGEIIETLMKLEINRVLVLLSTTILQLSDACFCLRRIEVRSK